jgi:hypothetical protein
MDDTIYFNEYKYIGVSGRIYTPSTKNGKWYVIQHIECTFLEFVYLCRVPDEEATILKLRYGIQSKESLL